MFKDANLVVLDDVERKRLLASIGLCSMRMPVATEDDFDRIKEAYFPPSFEPVQDQSTFAVRLFQLQAVHTNIRGFHTVAIAGTSSGKSSCIPIFWHYLHLQMQENHQVNPNSVPLEKPIGWDIVPTHLLMRAQAARFSEAGLTCAAYEPGSTSPDGQTETQVMVHDYSIPSLLDFDVFCV
jgi:hypothetical protein